LAGWIGRHRTPIAVVIAVLGTLGAQRGLDAYRRARMGRVWLRVPGLEYRVAEVLDAEARVLLTRETLPNVEPIELPAGDYLLRVSAPGLLPQSYRMAVVRGREAAQQFTPVLGDRQVAPPVPFGQCAMMLGVVAFDREKPGQADLIVAATRERNSVQLERIDGRTGRVVWSVPLRSSRHDRSARELLTPPPDLDGDGTPDLVLHGGVYGGSLVVASGRDGHDLVPAEGGLIGAPAVADLDGDGRLELLGSFFDQPESYRPIAGMWVAALAPGRREPLWRHAIAPEAFPELKGSGAAGWRPDPPDLLPSPPVVFEFEGRRLAAVLVHDRIHLLDAASGRPEGEPIALGFTPGDPPLPFDADGDGTPELLLRHLGAVRMDAPGLAATGGIAQGGAGRVNWLNAPVVAWSPKGRGPLWAVETPQRIRSYSRQALHQLVDLDGDGVSEIILANRKPPEVSFTNSNVSQIAVLDGRTGQTRWETGLPGRITEGFQQVAAGPDLDGDGSRELFTASYGQPDAEDDRMLFLVHAISGASGEVVWTWAEPEDPAVLLNQRTAGPLLWGQTGPDGHPLLYVWFTGGARTVALEASTGTLRDDLPGAGTLRLGDLDGDGTPDMATCFQGRLITRRGGPVETWRRLGAWVPAPDLNGDGVADLVPWVDYAQLSWGRLDGGGHPARAAAVSGADGRLLWQADGIGYPVPLEPSTDLDDDGTADLVVVGPRVDAHPPETVAPLASLWALSGRTGRRLWTTAGLPPDPDGDSTGKVASFVAVVPDRDGDRVLDLAVGYDAKNDQKLILSVSGRDGRLLGSALTAGLTPPQQAAADRQGWRGRPDEQPRTLPGPAGGPRRTLVVGGDNQYTACRLEAPDSKTRAGSQGRSEVIEAWNSP
jgi:hypothetical protein